MLFRTQEGNRVAVESTAAGFSKSTPVELGNVPERLAKSKELAGKHAPGNLGAANLTNVTARNIFKCAISNEIGEFSAAIINKAVNDAAT